MREIKFRLLNGNEIVGYLRLKGGWTQFQAIGRDDWYYPCNFKWTFAEQYIDRKDKNGVDLDWWEGDVFKCADTSIDRIIFKDGCFWMWSDKYQFRQPLYKCIAWSESYTKIDNIHENPKLLNK